MLHRVSKLSNQWVEIFRAGDYGDKGKFTPADIDTIVRNYDPSFHEAPAVVGHPEHDKPAYGWVDRLAKFGDSLFAKFKQVEPNFEEQVEKGRFPKRSISLYNTPNGPSLRHVGWLGAQLPEVKGLRNPVFHDENQKFTELDFAEGTTVADQNNEKNVAQLVVEAVKNVFAEKFGGKETAATSFSEADAKKMIDSAVTAAVKPLSEENEKLKKQFSDAQATAATDAQKSLAATAVAQLKAKGNWISAFDEMGLPQIFDEVAKSPITIEFGEADKTTGKKPTRTPLEAMVSFFEGLKKIVPTGVVYGGQKGTGTTAAGTVNFTESRNAKADPNSVKLAELTKQFMDEHNGKNPDKPISFAEAMNVTATKHPELTAPGGASAGEA